MKDFMVVHNAHTFIMNSPEVMEYALHFINYGCFKNNNFEHSGNHKRPENRTDKTG